MKFTLTNDQRRYLGLEPVGADWDISEIAEGYSLYYQGNVIRKSIEATDTTYHECEMNERTDEDRKTLLPKTTNGRAKILTLSAIRERPRLGVYFYYGPNGATFANYTTQTTYFTCYGDGRKYNGFDDLSKWLEEWIADTNDQDIADIYNFKNSARKHCKFQEGDFFQFKVGRREYGFGRILLDINRLRKTDNFINNKNYGLNYMGKPLIVKAYHYISPSPIVDIQTLSGCTAFPSQQILDNIFYFGECEIIGHKELEPEELEFPISYGRSINALDVNTVYLQYGLIYREADISKYSKYLYDENADGINRLLSANPYSNSGIGYKIDVLSDISAMKLCISEGSNEPWWNSSKDCRTKHDLRNPSLYEIKRDIFDYFNLDADASYNANMNEYFY